MILNNIKHTKEISNLIKDVVGKRFNLFQTLKMKGVTSRQMIIDDASSNMKIKTSTILGLNYTTLELRPTGILIKINKDTEHFIWVIPYYQLVIYKTNGLSIHAQGRFIHFKNNLNFRKNKLFFKKLLNEKLKFNTKNNFLSV